jgi:hypothetical protein
LLSSPFLAVSTAFIIVIKFSTAPYYKKTPVVRDNSQNVPE